jgi:3-phosphoshikimate 1-carboxyvinyltransferase
MHYLIQPAAIHDADVTVPGDKSVSHRAIMLGSIAQGVTEVRGFLAGEDCLATMGAFRSMGVSIVRPAPTELVIQGVGLHGLQPPQIELDLGNSGTAMRLMAGVLAGQEFAATLTGDESLTSRPMRRIITPLSRMGADIGSRDGRPPLEIRGNPKLAGIDYVLPMASAQVKSAILLAGLYARGPTTISEPAVTRDHTERMLRAMGVAVDSRGGCIGIQGPAALQACAVDVPADLSSAAFVILAALLADKADIRIRDVGVNPTRTGVLDILTAMGASIRLENLRDMGEEPVADIRVRSSKLHGIAVEPALVSLASDRIAAMAAGLRALGIHVEESDDGALVHGGQFAGGDVESFGDHRIAMSLAVAGTVADGPVTVRDVAAVETSFPGFEACLSGIGAEIVCLQDDPA